jgi:hypothetical protein
MRELTPSRLLSAAAAGILSVLASSAPAQCLAYAVPPGAPLYASPAGEAVFGGTLYEHGCRVPQRTTHLVGVPKGLGYGKNFGSVAISQDRAVAGACFEKDFTVDSETGRLQVVVLREAVLGLLRPTTVWVRPADLIPFTWTPTTYLFSDSDFLSNLGILFRGADHAVAARDSAAGAATVNLDRPPETSE